jgi:hypothetical protein
LYLCCGRLLKAHIIIIIMIPLPPARERQRERQEDGSFLQDRSIPRYGGWRTGAYLNRYGGGFNARRSAKRAQLLVSSAELFYKEWLLCSFVFLNRANVQVTRYKKHRPRRRDLIFE